MDISRLKSQLKQAEGVRYTAYRDSLGFWTAGVGHLLSGDKDLPWGGKVFSVATVDRWLDEDVATAESNAQGLLEWPSLDTDARQNALIELVFNMGLAHWKQFALTRAALAHKQWDAAHSGLLDSLWAKQVGPNRSNRLANQLLSGEFV